MSSLKKYLLIFAGTLSLILGIIGIFLPLLPTTPFLLLSSFCYLKSSKRMYNWLMNHKIFGKYIYNYIIYKAIPLKTKIGALIFLWTTLIISIMMVSSIHLKIILIVIGTGVTFHLLTLKTLSSEMTENLNKSYKNN